jgi:hypothetical protein
MDTGEPIQSLFDGKWFPVGIASAFLEISWFMKTESELSSANKLIISYQKEYK